MSNVRLFSEEELVELGIRRFGLEDLEYDLPPTEEHQKMIEDGLKDEAGQKLLKKAKANSEARAKAATQTTHVGSDFEFNTDNQKQGFTRKTFNESVEYIFNKPFVSAEQTKFLIPEEAKVDKNKFVMSDGHFESVYIWEGDNKEGFPILRETNDLKIINGFKNVIIETSHDEKYKTSNETDFMKTMVKNMRKK